MSCYEIEYRGGAKVMNPITSRKQYLELRNLAVHMDYVSRVRQGESDLKSRLLQFNYSCIPGEDGRLKGSKQMSTSVGIDVDHIPAEEMEAVKERILAKKDEIGLLMLERSVRCEGYHIVCKRVESLSQEDNIKHIANILGVEPDMGAKDITRVFFATTASPEDLIFLDDDIFKVEACEEVKSEQRKVENPESEGSTFYPLPDVEGKDDTSNGLPYNDIIPEFFRMENKNYPAFKRGMRNDCIFNVVAKYLRYCTDHDFALIKDLLYPQYAVGLSESEMDSIISSALSRERSLTPKTVKQVLAKYTDVDYPVTDEDDEEEAVNLQPKMPSSLPEFIKLMTSKVPDCYKPAVATQIFPALAAHLHQVRFRYIDNVEHEPGLMGVCIAQQSIGKGCVNKPVDCINADLIADNARNKALARQWRKDSAESEEDNIGLLSDKVYFPLPLVNMTDAAFTDRLRRLEQNGERTMFMKLDEIELLYQVNTGGDLKPDRLICLAYDRSEYGQERVSNNSISDSARTRWNWVASTTPPNARVFFTKGDAYLNGALTRLNICTIFQPNDPYFMPRYGIYDEEFQQKVNEYVARLNMASGLIQCTKVDRLIERLRLWCVDKAMEYEDKTERNIFTDFYKRALVIAFRKAMVLYIAGGNVWTKTMDDFIEWSLKYDLWCKFYYFSDLMISAYKSTKQGVRNMATEKKISKFDLIYDNLSQEFTAGEVDKQCKSLKVYTPSKVIISKWKSSGLVEKIGKKEFRKISST